jgi:hypothetical protein
MYLKKIDFKWCISRYLIDGMYATIDSMKNIFFTDISNGFLKANIAKTKFDNNTIQNIELLPVSINSQYQDAHPFISPGGGFIIFDSYRPGG